MEMLTVIMMIIRIQKQVKVSNQIIRLLPVQQPIMFVLRVKTLKILTQVKVVARDRKYSFAILQMKFFLRVEKFKSIDLKGILSFLLYLIQINSKFHLLYLIMSWVLFIKKIF